MPTSSAAPADVGGRYEIHELLGRGGMACVYRATDRSSGRLIALKQLVVPGDAPEHASASALFEREFQTLMQLRHPHVIEVYEYGLCSDGKPFYTMELLDGGDLRERSPLPWRDACRLAFDVCSALALLHSRRLLHRDVSPRNIRCTQAGHAKLIDFGAMAPMSGGGSDVVGTPAFTAPETLQRLALDARTDLYSLGVSLYFGLTGRLPYAARSFSELLSAWQVKPVPPSALVPGIPAALDDLVLVLIAVEPALRPQSAFAVMSQLAACAQLHVEESDAVSRAYLSTPSLLGREGLLLRVREMMRDARLSRAAGVLFEGPPGAGRSRLLDACALEAQTRGFTVLRATATGTRESFATARALTEHLLDALPAGPGTAELLQLLAAPAQAEAEPGRQRLRSFDDPALEPARVQRAVRALWTNVSRTHPLLIAVDDVHRIDEPSAALLAELIDKTRRGGILVALTADSEQEPSAALLALGRRCTGLQLTALSLDQSRDLLGSLFGDVAHLDVLATEIHRVADGNPRQILELAQHLVDQGTIRYAAGRWTLPSALSPADLPRTTALALRARVERLSAHARFMAEAQALAFYETFADGDYHLLRPDVSSTDIERAIAELLSAQILLREDDRYRLAHRMWAAALSDGLEAQETKLRHRALAGMYERKQSFAYIHHAFLAGMDEQALTVLDGRNTAYRTEAELLKLMQEGAAKLVWCYPRAIATAQALGKSAREIQDLRRWQYLGTVMGRAAVDHESARAWLAQLKHDSGLDLYRADGESSDPGPKLMRALQGAQQRYLATPEHERVYPVDQAIRKLGEYVVISLALAGSTLDVTLSESLPPLLEPFVPLSPLLEGIWNNALGTMDSLVLCHYERALERWRETLAKLDALSGVEESFLEGMRNAIAFAIGLTQAQLGLPTAAAMAERLDRDPYQRVAALDLRRIVRLEQGDAEGAERLRRQAEVLALQLRVPPMFNSLLMLELQSYARIGDLQGVAHVIERMKPIAALHPRWKSNLLIAQASFHLVRGDHEAALSLFEQSVELAGQDGARQPGVWLVAQAGMAECLLALGRAEEAHARASAAVAVCESKQVVAGAIELVRLLALAEGKLGHPGAAERLDRLLALQTQLGAAGLRLGMTYEARARVAIWSGDAAAFEQLAQLTAAAYRHGARTALAARYERLVNEAARCGMRTHAALAQIAAPGSEDTSALGAGALSTVITRSMANSRSAEERTQLALQMICAAHDASIGHLYLLTPAGPVLRASCGADQPARELSEHVASYVADQQKHSNDLDDMITGELAQDQALESLLQAGGASYELLPLACVVDAVSTLAGVAIVQLAEARPRTQSQAQLLSGLAASLVQSGDCVGMRLSPAE